MSVSQIQWRQLRQFCKILGSELRPIWRSKNCLVLLISLNSTSYFLCFTKNISKSERTLETSDLLLGVSISSRSYYIIFFIKFFSTRVCLICWMTPSSIFCVWCKSQAMKANKEYSYIMSCSIFQICSCLRFFYPYLDVLLFNSLLEL